MFLKSTKGLCIYIFKKCSYRLHALHNNCTFHSSL